jgi:hypothetical protein
VIVRTEVDNDISALNGKHRPGYKAVMAGLLGEFDTMESEVKAERQQLSSCRTRLLCWRSVRSE